MDTETALQKAAEILKPWTRWSKNPEANRLTVSVSRKDLLEAIAALQAEKWGYLSAITGLDVPGVVSKTPDERKWEKLSTEAEQSQALQGESFVVLYQFCEGAAVLTLRVHPPSLEDAVVPSVCSLIPSATLYERELIEMFGIEVTDTPNTEKLLLPDDWPDGVYPLRKAFTGLDEAQSTEKGA